MLLLCSSSGGTSVLLRYRFLPDRATADTLFTQNFLSGVGDLSKNRFLLRKMLIKYTIVCIPNKTIPCKCFLIQTNCANYLAARFKGLIALGAGEALLMVCVAHRWDHFAFDVALTNGAFGAECFLVVGDAIIVGIFWKKSSNGQWFITLDALKAAFVEVFVGHPQNLAGTFFLAFRAVDFCFTCGTNLFIYIVFPQHVDINRQRARQINENWAWKATDSNQCSSSEETQ